ncbi:MAG: hypothetical protein WCO96_00400 [Actinomycetes bacterium]
MPCRRSADGTLRWGPRYRVLYYGDSLGLESARFARMLLGERGAVMVDRAISGSSPCDWMKVVPYDLAGGRPDAVIAETVGNALSRCQLSPSGAKPQWNSVAYWKRYTSDLARFSSMFPASTGVWLAPPPATRNDRSSGYSHKAKMLSVMRKVASARVNSFAVDAGAAIEVKGSYSRIMPCLAWDPVCLDEPRRGMNIVRALDGTHFCPVAIKATIDQLRNCSPNPGAYRFAIGQVTPVLNWLASNR